MNDKVVGLPKPEADELREAIEGIKRSAPVYVEYNKMMANLRMEYYKNLLDEGFDANQALHLATAMELPGG